MATAKRKHDGMGISSQKRKHVTLTILQKVEIINKMEAGSSVNYLADTFGISKRTVYDIKKNKEKILKFYSNTDSNVGIANRKTMKESKSVNLDNILYEWFKQRRSENVPITGPFLQEKAKLIHKDLKIENACTFSRGWLKRFKQRHGLRYLKLCGEKSSANNEASEDFIDAFSSMIAEENLSPEQIYNMDETGLFWRCLPRTTLVAADEKQVAGFKESKDRITIVTCSNAAGTHKCKLYVIGKSAQPRALKGVKVLPVIYKNNKKAWITRDLTADWFKNFVKEAHKHCSDVGLSTNCKILLLLDNCTAHADIDVLSEGNVTILYLPPNTTSLIQPMDQGIINSLKCHYRSNFLCKLINVTPSSDPAKFQKNFNLKDCIYMLSEAWNEVSQETLTHAWHNLWPSSLFIETENDQPEFSGFRQQSAKNKIEELLLYAKNKTPNLNEFLRREDILHWMSSNDEAPVASQLTDEEIIESVLNPAQENSDTESDDEQEKITFDEGLALGQKYLNFLEQQSFVTQQEIMTVYRLQDKIQKHKPNILKQTTIDAMLKKYINK